MDTGRSLLMLVVSPGLLNDLLDDLFRRQRIVVTWSNGRCKMTLSPRHPFSHLPSSGSGGYQKYAYTLRGGRFNLYIHCLSAFLDCLANYSQMQVGTNQWKWFHEGFLRGNIIGCGIQINHLCDKDDFSPEHLSYDTTPYNMIDRRDCFVTYCLCHHIPRCRKFFCPPGTRCACNGFWGY